MSTPVIETRGLVTRIDGRTIHDGLDLDVQRGELLAIAGGSGSGKTLLLRTLALLRTPDAGRLRLFGSDTDQLDARADRALRRRMGVMFQQGALFTGLTVLENVVFPLAEHSRLPAALLRDIARAKLRLVGLDPAAGALQPAQLSGGMTKRAAVARALALDPELLFLDEPTSGLDPGGAEAFDDMLRELQATLDLTLVVITHDADSLWSVAERIAFIADGRILGTGTAEDLARSNDPRIATYFGGGRMQRARGQ